MDAKNTLVGPVGNIRVPRFWHFLPAISCFWYILRSDCQGLGLRSIEWLFNHRCYIHLRWSCYSCWQQCYTPPCLSLFVLLRLRRKTSQPTTNQLECFTLRFGFVFFILLRSLCCCWIIKIILFIDCHRDYYIMMKVMFEEVDRPTNHKAVGKLCSGCRKTV